jgi:hypothetical protein
VKEILIRSGCLKPSAIAQSGSPSGPREVHLLYQTNCGEESALRRSDMVEGWITVFRTIIIVTYGPRVG